MCVILAINAFISIALLIGFWNKMILKKRWYRIFPIYAFISAHVYYFILCSGSRGHFNIVLYFCIQHFGINILYVVCILIFFQTRYYIFIPLRVLMASYRIFNYALIIYRLYLPNVDISYLLNAYKLYNIQFPNWI